MYLLGGGEGRGGTARNQSLVMRGGTLSQSSAVLDRPGQPRLVHERPLLIRGVVSVALVRLDGHVIFIPIGEGLRTASHWRTPCVLLRE